MAKAKTKKAAVKKTSRRASSRVARVRGGARRRDSHIPSRVIMPLAIVVFLLVGIAFFGWMGYSTATASAFFAAREVQVLGTNRVSADDVKRIVTANTEKTGVWRSDLSEIRSKIEKLPFVKSASVSMKLPGALVVNISERVPVALVKLSGGDYLVDIDSVVLAPATKREDALPFAMRGWDEAKTEKAAAENTNRLKLYKKMLDEWSENGIAKRVREVNLTDTRDPIAMIEDSGKTISVSLSRDNLGKGLRSAIEAVAGKGEKIRSVNAAGVYPVIEYAEN
jgi:cell division septal protein FtsQ